MGFDVSPAVLRASAAALASAHRRNRDVVRLPDWLLGLLDDDEGKPSVLLQQLGADREAVCAAIGKLAGKWPAAPPDEVLYKSAIDISVALRGEPLLTTEFVFLAVLSHDANFRAVVAEVGVSAVEVERRLRTDRIAVVGPGTGESEFVVADPQEHVDAGRIVDANLNRARESLRILDDYCRFVLDDKLLTETVKDLRHRLSGATAKLPSSALLAARDTPGDVGKGVTAAGEYSRESPAQVAAINLKRLQESLRSVEEYGKVFGAEFAKLVEQIRYDAYTLERAVVIGASVRSRLADAKVYVLLTAAQCKASLDWTIAEAAAGGADIIQLREKTLTDREFLERARNVRRWTHKAGVLFLVNDRPDIARLSEADGVHLGQTDVSFRDARRILGPDALIGISTHTLDQVRRAVFEGADYIGVGPTFPSKTKRFEQFPGVEFVRKVAAETSLPAFVLGGISAKTLPEAVAAGARRAAVSSFVAQADDPRSAARSLREILTQSK